MIDSIGSGSGVGGASLSAVQQEEPVQAAKSEGRSAEMSQVAPASLQPSEGGGPSANSDAAVVQISAEARALAGS